MQGDLGVTTIMLYFSLSISEGKQIYLICQINRYKKIQRDFYTS